MKNLVFLIITNMLQTGCSYVQNRSIIELINIALDENVISPNCYQAMKLYQKRLNSTKQEDFWALEMLEATSRPPLSPISYNFDDMGHFEQCISIQSNFDKIMGKYCLADLIIDSKKVDNEFINIRKDLYMRNYHLQIDESLLTGHSFRAICIPNNCTDDDAMHFVSSVQTSGFKKHYLIYCQTIDDAYPKVTNDAVIGMSIFGFLIYIIVVSTYYDIYCNKKKIVSTRSVLIAFSALTNGKKLFEIPSQSSRLSCLNGIRVLSMAWIILFHLYKTTLLILPIYYSKATKNFRNSILNIIAINGTLACDSFFVVGGTLVTYLYFKKDKLEDITIYIILKQYFHRYVRLSSALVGTVLLSATLLEYFGSGPMWPIINNLYPKECWWKNFIYIANEIDETSKCFRFTWYIDVDMQLYIFSPIIILILKKHTTIGIVMLILASITSIIVTFVKVLLGEGFNFGQYQGRIYSRTETRAAPWLIGTILGYILATTQLKDVRISKKVVISLWILALIVMIIILIGTDTLKYPGNSRIRSAFFLAIFRPIFAMAIVWIIWACYTNNGGIIDKILSSHIFGLLNKFTYNIYLLHNIVLHVLLCSTKTPLYVDLFTFASLYCGVFMLTLLLSTIWILLFESPMMNLEKIVLQPKLKNKSW